MSELLVSDVIRLGSRGSPLALWQTRSIEMGLHQYYPELRTEIVIVRTAGDRNRRDPLSKLGGKGIFVKELEESLTRGDIDVAVHSLKDMPTVLPDGLHFAAIPARGEVRDVFIGRDGRGLDDAAATWRIGAGSLRRQSQLLARHAGLQVCDIRGNVDTRLRKLHEGEVDGLVLAAAGLIRLERQDEITEYLPVEMMLPAVGQGALAVETRRGDRVDALLAPLHDVPTAQAVTAERAFLAHLSGGCMVPIAALGEVTGTNLQLQGLVSSPRGNQVLRQEVRGPALAAEALGRQLADEMLVAGAHDILANLTC